MDQHMIEIFGAVLIAVITTLIGPVILEYVKVKLSRQSKVDPIKKELEYSCIIAEELEEIRALLKADRFFIAIGIKKIDLSFLTMVFLIKKII